MWFIVMDIFRGWRKVERSYLKRIIKMNDIYDYGLWLMVILNLVIFIFFVFSFVKLKFFIDW